MRFLQIAFTVIARRDCVFSHLIRGGMQKQPVTDV